MQKATHILIVEAISADAELAKRVICEVLKDCHLQVVETRNDFLNALETFQPDVILADYALARLDGITALKLARKHAPLTPVIIWAGSSSEDLAVDCLKAGANNYVLKENSKRLGPAVIHALEERQLLLAHEQAEQKYKSIFENSMEGIFQSSPQGRFLKLNPAMARIYGYDSPAEMIESVKDIATQIHAEPHTRSSFMSRLHAQNQIQNFEAKNYRRDGSIIWTSTSARTVCDPNGHVLYYEGYVQDITQRKQVEEELQRNEKRFRALIENGLDDISLVDVDGTLLWESPSTTRNLGYAPNEFVGRNMFELLHPEDMGTVRQTVARLLQTPGERQHGTFRLRRVDGTWRWVEAIGTNLLSEPGVNAIVVNYRDVTEQKQIEIELQQKNADLALVNSLNEVINRGESLSTLVGLLRDELKRIFDSDYTNMYLFDPDDRSLTMQNYSLPSEITRKIESVIGRAIPPINIPVQEGGLFQRVLRSGESLIISSPQAMQEWMAEFAETSSLSPAAKAVIRKLLPQIYKALNIKSTVLVPLISDGRPLGVLNVSGSNLFTEQDVRRIESICGQLTTALRRKQVEEALRESQARYQKLVETSHDLIWSVDAEGRITYVNHAAKEIYGYEPQELVGRSFFDLLDPDYSHPLEFGKFKEIIAETDEFSGIETSLRHRDGRQVTMSANAVVVRDDDGNLIGITGTSRDITARKRVEEMLREERNLLRTLIDHIPDRIYAMDIHGRKTLSNTADWQASGGKTMQDVVGKTDFDTYPADLAEGFWQLDKAVLESGQVIVNYEEPGLDSRGKRVSILTTKIPLRDQQGKVTGLVGIGREITERKLAEARINDLLAFNEKMLNLSATGILTYAVSGQCVFANEKAASIVGTTVPQLMMQNFRIIESWKESGLYDLVEKAINTQMPATEDIHHVSTFGKDVWMTVHCVTFKAKGEDHILLSISDITERKQAEEKLRESENRYRLALKATNDVIWEADLLANKLFWSENAQTVFGYSPQEVDAYATWWDDHLHPDDRERVLSKLESLIAGDGTLWVEEYRFQLKAGSYAYISDRGYIERAENGTPLRIIGAMTDITERKQAEDKLRESENRLVMALSGAQMSVWEWDLKTNQIFWSPEFFKITGVDEEQFAGTFESFTDLIHSDDVARVRAVAERAVREQSLFAEEFRIIAPDGEVRWLSNLGRAEYDSTGTHLHLIGTVQDVTQRKQAEIERQALLEIMQGLADTEDLHELMKLIHSSIAQVIYAKNFFVVLYRPNTGLFEEIYSVDQYDPPEPPAKLENSITSYVFRSGDPLLLTQVLFDELVKQGEMKLVGTNSASWLGVPLKTSGRTIGVMAVQDYEYDNRYTERDKQFLASIAAQIALVIERKQAEEALTLFRSLIDHSSDMIEVVDPETSRFLDVNEQACRAHGYTRDEYLALTVDDIDPLAATQPQLADDALVRSGSLVFESLHRRKDGSVFPVEVTRNHICLDRDYNLSVVRDITERKQAEEALHKSEALYRQAIEVAGAVPYYETYYDEGRSIKYEFIGEGIRQITGYGPDEFNATVWDSLVEEIHLVEDLAGYSLEEGIERVRAGKNSTWKCEHRIRARDGKIHWVFEAAVELRDQNGISYGSIGTYQDITERKQAEQALRESEEHYRAIFEGVQDAIFVEALDGRILTVNQRACEMFGYSYEEFLTKTVKDIVPEGNLILAADGENSLLSTEPHETFNRRANGEIFPIDISGRIQVINGETVLLVVVRDITERKKAEALLRESEDRFSSAFEYASIGMALVSPEGRWLRVNWALCELVGYSEEELSQRTFQDITYADDLERDLGYIQQMLAGEIDSYQMEKRYVHKSGQVIWVLLSASLVRDNEGRPLYFISQIQDITERKRSEAAEREQRALAEALRDTAETLSSTLDYGEVLDHILSAVGRVVPHHAATIMLIDGAHAHVVRSHGYDQHDFNTEIMGIRLPVAKTTNLRQMIETRQPVVVYDTHSYPGWKKMPATAWLRSSVGAPISIYGEMIGFICLDGQAPNFFTPIHAERLEAFANQAALAIHNARLLQQAQQEITERRQAEASLRAEREKIKNYLDIAGVLMLALDHDGTVTLINQKGCEILGYSAGEIIGKNWIKTFLPESCREEMQGVFQELISGNIEPFSYYENTILTKNGEERLLAWHNTVVRDSQGRIISTLSSGEDITERRRAEEELRFEKERLEKIAAAVPGLIGSLRLRPDGSGCMPFASPAIQDVYGFLPAELEEDIAPFFARVHPEDLPQLNTLIQESARTMLPWHGEFRYHHPTKGEVWIEGRSMPLREEDGSTIWHGFLYDITERKEAEEELRASEERFRQLANNIQEVFWMTDSRSGEEIYMSPAAETIWGLPIETLMHEPNAFINSVYPEDRALVLQNIEKEKNGGKVEMEYRIVRPDGSLRWVWDRAFPIFDDSGSVKRIAGISADITERRESELALVKSQSRYRELFDSSPVSIWEEDFSLVKKRVDSLFKSGVTDLREYFSSHPEEVIELASLVIITDANQTALGLYGVEHKEDLLKSLTEALGGEPLTHFQEEILGFLSPDRKFVWEGTERMQDGRQVELVVTGSIPYGYEEDWSKVIVSIIDITERKQAEESLRESEARYHGLFQNLVDGFALHEIITDDQGRPIDYIFLEVNPAFESMTGLEASKIVGRPVTEVLPGVENERFIPLYGQVALTGTPVHFEEYSEPLGMYFEINAYSPKLGQFAVTFVNITERRKAEDEIRRRAEENSILLKTSLALTNLDLKTTLQTVGDSAKNLFAADGCRIFLMEPDGKSLRCVLALQESLDAFADLRVRIGEGVTGSVAASGQAEIVNNMEEDPRAVQVTGTPEEEEAIMFAPLKERGNTLGVLSVRRTGGDRPFQPVDLELLEALASMAASAVSNARLFAETQRRLSELEALYENGLAVGRLLKPNQIGNRLIHTFSSYLPWHHVTIRLREDASDDLELVAFSLPSLKDEEQAHAQQHFIARINKVGQGLSGWVIETGIPLRTGNVHAHPQYIDTHAGIQSGLYMPLKVGERVIGVISVESEVPDAFTEQDERLLATLASQAAIAFENARLYQAIEQELSERKRAQEALLISETHYRALADSITDILFELDQDLRYTHWNKASEIFSGISAEDAIGRSMQELFGTSEEQSRREEIYKSVLKERRARTFETEVFAKGEKRDLEINAYPSARGVSVVAKDVTERKRSEIIMQKRFELMEYSAHHSLDELMQRAVDEVSDLTGSTIGFFHFVHDDQKTLGMQTWSTNALKLFNVPVSEGTHLPLDQAGVWVEAVHQRRPLIQNDYESLPERKGFPQGHVPIRREIVIPIIRNEKVMAIMGIGNKPQEYTPYDLEIATRLADYAWDITERKQMQVALEVERNQLARRVEERTADLSQANSNLARALRVKDEFLANMSHELRTPLNAILGLSESLGEQIAGPLNEKQQKYITTISESGHHLLSLINDILDLAKIEAGQITLDINKVDIHSVCQASLRMVKQLAQKKNQQVFLDIEEGLGLMWADERRLKQMIVNLLGNAVKFTPENGKIGLEVRGEQGANKVSMTVWDTGIGIKEDDLARLFQPFVQLDSGLAREATGTGLGLALVAQMARLHGGSVSAASNPGQGSRFSIILPWEPALAMDTASRLRTTGKFRAIKPDEANKSTILLVEDTKEVVMLLLDYLELAGYKVVTARDGVEAIAQARLAHPDLILMDVMMPRMDGFEATRKLRSEPEFKYTPIVALTALAMPSDRERCLAAGMNEYISKPINLKALLRVIQSCLFGNPEAKK